MSEESVRLACGIFGGAQSPTYGSRGASVPLCWDAPSDITAACEGVAVCAEQLEDFEGSLAESDVETDPDESASAPAWREEQSDVSETHFVCSPCVLPVDLGPPELVTEECACPARGLLGGAKGVTKATENTFGEFEDWVERHQTWPARMSKKDAGDLAAGGKAKRPRMDLVVSTASPRNRVLGGSKGPTKATLERFEGFLTWVDENNRLPTRMSKKKAGDPAAVNEDKLARPMGRWGVIICCWLV